MIRALFVDLGGVLADEGFVPGVRAFAEKQGFDPDAFYAACHDGPHWKDFTRGLITEDAYFKAVRSHFLKSFTPEKLRDEIFAHTVLHNDVFDFLRSLKGRYILGIISNHSAEWYQALKEKFYFGDLFSVEAVSGIVHARKPDLKIFQYALDRAQVKGEEALYVDDAEKHFEGARSLDMRTILYTTLDVLKKELPL